LNTRTDPKPKLTILPVLAGLLVLCVIGAAALTVLTRAPAASAAPPEALSLVLQRIPFEAQNALRGETSAFDALGKSAAELQKLRAQTGGGDAAVWKNFDGKVATVVSARQSVDAIQGANQEARDLAPKLLSELGDLGSSVGTSKLEGMSRYLERFELMVQRIQQDLNGLSSGVSDAAPAAQRLADSLEFLNQVMRGLSGEESGLAISKVTGADSEQRLKTVVQRNLQYTNAVRKAIAAAETLSKAQAATRELPPNASALASELASAQAPHAAGPDYKSLI